MKDDGFYQSFATDWIESWNRRDMGRIMSHYDEALKFSSPKLAQLIPGCGGTLTGKDAVRGYWTMALAAQPELHFELDTVLKGVDSAVICYKGAGGRQCAEFFAFAANGLVVESHAHGE